MGLFEIGIVFILVILIFGPKRLPKLVRMITHWLTYWRKFWNKLQGEAEKTLQNINVESKKTKQDEDHEKEDA